PPQALKFGSLLLAEQELGNRTLADTLQQLILLLVRPVSQQVQEPLFVVLVHGQPRYVAAFLTRAIVPRSIKHTHLRIKGQVVAGHRVPFLISFVNVASTFPSSWLRSD